MARFRFRRVRPLKPGLPRALNRPFAVPVVSPAIARREPRSNTHPAALPAARRVPRGARPGHAGRFIDALARLPGFGCRLADSARPANWPRTGTSPLHPGGVERPAHGGLGAAGELGQLAQRPAPAILLGGKGDQLAPLLRRRLDHVGVPEPRKHLEHRARGIGHNDMLTRPASRRRAGPSTQAPAQATLQTPGCDWSCDC